MHLSFCYLIHLLNYSTALFLAHSPFNRLSERAANDVLGLYREMEELERSKKKRSK